MCTSMPYLIFKVYMVNLREMFIQLGSYLFKIANFHYYKDKFQNTYNRIKQDR